MFLRPYSKCFIRSAIQKLLAPYGLREINENRGRCYIRFDDDEAAMKVMGAVNIRGLRVSEKFWRRPSGEGSSGASLTERTSDVGATSSVMAPPSTSNVRPTPVSRPTLPSLPAIKPAPVNSTPSNAAAIAVPAKPGSAPDGEFFVKDELMYCASANPKIATW